jgi:hypothetical protein
MNPSVGISCISMVPRCRSSVGSALQLAYIRRWGLDGETRLMLAAKT